MKRLYLIILAMLLLAAPAFSQKKPPSKVKIIVIDPGHGGDKPGAIGRHVKEKDLTLAIARKFGRLIADNYPDVNIIYTRTSDEDVTLAERAHIANRNHADLFISIHANSHKTTAPTGVETFVMGLSQSKANLEVAKTENADILLEEGYRNNSDYQGFDPNSPESFVMFAMFQNAYLTKSLNFAQYIQNQYKLNLHTIDRGVKQAELFVIYKTTMPAVLTEVGFISNPDEEKFMMSDEGQAMIALSLFNAFAAYKQAEDGTPKPSIPVVNLPGYGKNADAPAQEKPAPAQADTVPDTASVHHDTLKSQSSAPDSASFHDLLTSRPDPAPLPDPVVQDQVVYKVQFFSHDELLPQGHKLLKGISDFDYYRQGGKYRYTRGSVSTVREAVSIQNQTRAMGFPDAFVVAFHNGERITLQQAKEIISNL